MTLVPAPNNALALRGSVLPTAIPWDILDLLVRYTLVRCTGRIDGGWTVLDLTSLALAVEGLERSLAVAAGLDGIPGATSDLRRTVRSGVIQDFEVAYELAWKFIQRWIRDNRTPEDADHPRTRKELFRMAARFALIGDPVPWFEYGDARNLTAHTYDEATAGRVVAVAGRFVGDARVLLERLSTSQ